jgi:polar amino acid transport system ATP-binding protein/sulfate transport system ATP-binding protein
MNAPIVLSASDVHVSRSGTAVLGGVSFDIVDRTREGAVTGQVVCILGPSGVGKTTLLRVLAGLDAPDAGAVTGVAGAPLVAGDVGLVFQDYPLIAHRTVRDNVVLAGTLRGLSGPKLEARSDELLARVGLVAQASLFPAQLSGGQRQRAAIAQQLVVPRRLLLLDEPFSGLDPAALAGISELVVAVANEHDLNTVVIVTHDVRAALRVSDTVIILGRGATGGGARVIETIDLCARGIAWGEGDDAARARIEREITERLTS